MKHSVRLSVLVLSVSVVVALMMASGPAAGQTPKAKAGPMAKVGTDLAALSDAHEAYQLRSSATAVRGPFKPQNPLARVVDGRVVIDAVASGDVDALRADLEALGMQKARTFGRWVSGQLPIPAIKALATLDSLKFARPAYAKTNVGLVTSQGDAAMRADDARTTFGVDGSGIKVGAMSDSFDCQGGAAADIASGDLPAGGVVVLQDETRCSSGSDEGRALLQVIHDVAPGASLAFHTAFDGFADFAQGILDLAAAGAKVIVDDVIYYAEAMFQDDLIAQAVDTVKAMGVAYFSAAGNQGRDAYESGFNNPDMVLPFLAFPSVAGAPLFFGGTPHDFDPGLGVDVFQQITVPVGSGFIISFQWDSPFFSICGATGCPAGSPNDLDIYVLDSQATTVLAGSADGNFGGDAVELFGFFNDGSFDFDNDGVPDTVFNIMIVNFFGPDPGFMKYVRFDTGPGVVVNEFDTASGTIYGHANAAGAMAVGAAFYVNTPEFGVDPALLEPFSSAGPTRTLFTPDGTPTFELRQKPEFVAPDGANTTFFFPGLDVEPDGFPNFFGTSPSAAHAAGVAALMWEANPSLSPGQIYTTMQDTALNMGPAASLGLLSRRGVHTALDMGPPGFDFDSGHGLVSAFAAVGAVVNNGGPACPDVPPSPEVARARGYNLIVGTEGNDVLVGTPGNDMIFGLGGNDIIYGLGGDDILCGGPGNDTIYGGSGDDFIDGGPGNDRLYGQSGNDTIHGGEGDDLLYGQEGDDVLDGGPGNDLLNGGTGTDTCINGERRISCEL